MQYNLHPDALMASLLHSPFTSDANLDAPLGVTRDVTVATTLLCKINVNQERTLAALDDYRPHYVCHQPATVNPVQHLADDRLMLAVRTT